MGGVLVTERGIWKADLVGHCGFCHHIIGSCSCLRRGVVVSLVAVVWQQVGYTAS